MCGCGLFWWWCCGSCWVGNCWVKGLFSFFGWGRFGMVWVCCYNCWFIVLFW